MSDMEEETKVKMEADNDEDAADPSAKDDSGENDDENKDENNENDNDDINNENSDPQQQQQQQQQQKVVTIDMKTMPLPPRAPELLHSTDGNEPRLYWDRSHYDSPASQLRALALSSTLYVGNLAFTTRVSHVRSQFALLGRVQRIVMGLDRIKKTPCGFCFVEYASRKHALTAVAQLSGTKLDGRVIRVELDAGFQPGRQYGRGKAGGQVRDDRKSGRQKGGQQQQHVGQKRSRNDNYGNRNQDNINNNNNNSNTNEASTEQGVQPNSGVGEEGYYGPSGDGNENADNNDNENSEQGEGDEDRPAKRQRT